MNHRFFYRAQVNAPVEVAWNVFTEHEKFSQWTNIDWVLTKDGSPERNGLGCIRQQRATDATLVKAEEIVNYWVPLQLYGFHLISSEPFDSHQTIVRFFPKGPNKSEWVYDAQFRFNNEVSEAVPDIHQNLSKYFTYFMHDAECECERRACDINVPAFPPAVKNIVTAGK